MAAQVLFAAGCQADDKEARYRHGVAAITEA
jgi:hypothetical protein